MKLSLDVW